MSSGEKLTLMFIFLTIAITLIALAISKRPVAPLLSTFGAGVLVGAGLAGFAKTLMERPK